MPGGCPQWALFGFFPPGMADRLDAGLAPRAGGGCHEGQRTAGSNVTGTGAPVLVTLVPGLAVVSSTYRPLTRRWATMVGACGIPSWCTAQK
ncbi:hypothetical protein SAMN05444320_106111 [Streptoalloteichus hindustanus]|uniref:Uncharacterized protein n=1 Tax=Streptoalloteichus hindustanus TaxID=2017 RepID=A0A1M5GG89_STRHI|nr:hypothetical protein SAMN05444320_106111 [Streptoalloteichus hindustanus]